MEVLLTMPQKRLLNESITHVGNWEHNKKTWYSHRYQQIWVGQIKKMLIYSDRNLKNEDEVK